MRHGGVSGDAPGREFRLRPVHEARAGPLRVEVPDASPLRPPAAPALPSGEEESGRGLFLVNVLADRWGVAPRGPAGKTVWAQVAARPPLRVV